LIGKIVGEFAKDFSRRSLEDIASLIAEADLHAVRLSDRRAGRYEQPRCH